jgi:hypothetical protein
MAEQNNNHLKEQLEKKDRDLTEERYRYKKLFDQIRGMQGSEGRNRSGREDELIQEIERLTMLVIDF